MRLHIGILRITQLLDYYPNIMLRSPSSMLAWAALLACSCSIAPKHGASAEETLTDRIGAALAVIHEMHGTVGAAVESLPSGRTIFRLDSNRAFIPASNMKILTAAAALDLLGPDFTYKTRLLATARPSAEGEVRGDLVIEGGGDPSFGGRPSAGPESAVLEEWVSSLVEAGVRGIDGSVIGYGGLIEGGPLGKGWSWDDEPYGFSARLSGMCFSENSVRFSIFASDPPLLIVEPWLGGVSIEAEVCRAGHGCEPGVSILETANGGYLIKAGFSKRKSRLSGRIAVNDPPVFAARALRDVLRRKGIEVSGEAVDAAALAGFKLPEKPAVVFTHTSPPLASIVRAMNVESLNLHAEMLFRTLGLAARGSANAESAEEAVIEFLKKAGVEAGDVSIADGSGLSRMNLLTPDAILKVLKYAYNSSFSTIFLESLPVAGESGTLESRMAAGPAAGRVKAKTGSMTHVRALSGFARTASGRTLAFSILVNNYTGDWKPVVKAIDQVCALLAGAEGI